MEVAFELTPSRDPGLFEQVPFDVGSSDAPDQVEVDAHELAEPGRVVVLDRLRVPKGLEDRVRLEDLAFKPAELLCRGGAGECGGASGERVE